MLYNVTNIKDSKGDMYSFFVQPILKSYLDWGLKREYSGWSGPNGGISHTKTPNGPEMIEDHIYDLKWGVITKWDLIRATFDLELDSISLTLEPGTLYPNLKIKEKHVGNIKFECSYGKLFFNQHRNQLYNIEIDFSNIMISENNEMVFDNNLFEKKEDVIYPFSKWISLEIEKSKNANQEFHHLNSLFDHY